MSRCAITEEDNSTSKEERKIASAQYMWISELNRQTTTSISPEFTTYQRPKNTSPIPKLQGPFSLGADMDEIFEITDIHCIPAVEEEEDFSAEDYAPNAEHAVLSVGLICIATTDNQVHVCIDAGGVEARWLPSQISNGSFQDEQSLPELLLVKSLSLGPNAADGCPTFTIDEQSRYSLLVTHGGGVARLSFHEWANKLEEELAGVYDTGAEFRVELLVESARFDLEQIIEVPKALSDSETSNSILSTCLNFQDSDLGNFFLTVIDGQPQAVTMETSSLGLLLEGEIPEDMDNEDIVDMVGNELRPSYQPPQELWNESVLGATVRESMQGRSQRVLKEDVRLSPLTLKIVMDAHRVLSHETHQLGLAAADLFRRCERLQDEFREQIRRVHQASSRVDNLLDGEDDAEVFSQQDEPGSDTGVVAEGIERRLRMVRSRQESLVDRCASIRDKVGRLNKHPLTEKEKAWISEVKSMDQLVSGSQKGEQSDEMDETEAHLSTTTTTTTTTPWQRLAEVERLRQELKGRADEIKGDEMEVAQELEDDETASSVLSPERGKQQLRQIFVMLERESALVEATKAKLDRLSLMTM